MHQLSSLVRGRRGDLGLSQEQVAARAGVSRKWVSTFERGNISRVELALVLRLLDALDLSVAVSPTNVQPPTPHDAGGHHSEDDLDLDELVNRQVDSDY
jgi:transcriptional regulator with XRE-family HTH domain